MGWFKRRGEEEDELASKVRYAAELHGVKPKEVVDTVLDEDDADEAEYEEYEAGRKRSRVGLWVTLACVGLVFGLGIVLLMKLANAADKAGPVAEAGMQALQKSIAPTPAANPTLSGTHIMFMYPAVFDMVQHPANWPNTSERYALGSKADYRKSIQVYVENAASGLKGDSGYAYRSQNTSEYQATNVKVMGEPAVIMVKSDLSERTLYWPHGGNLVIMSVTGEGNYLEGYLSVITSSLRWIP
jgi:hypothetical protein